METKVTERARIPQDKDLTNVLLVEDDAVDRRIVERLLARRPQPFEFAVDSVGSLSAAIECLDDGEYDIALLDLGLPDSSGIETVRGLSEVAPHIPIVVLTGLDDEETGLLAIKNGATDYLVKNRSLENLLVRTILYALERQKQKKLILDTNRQLQISKANFHSIVEKNSDGIIVVDKDGVVRFVNPATESIFARKAEELLGNLFGFPVMGVKVTEVDIVRPGKGPGIAEMRVLETEWSGQSAYLVLLRDITERKRAKEQIEHAAQEWRTTFDSITDMISIHDRNFKITRVNRAFANTFKIEPKELIGKTCYEVFHNAKKPPSYCPHLQTIKAKKPLYVEYFEPSLGKYLGISTSPVFEENGEITGSVHIAKDITERKQAEERLRKANEKLKEYNQLKDEFISTTSHELRTPLSIIIGAIRLVLDEIPGKIVEEQRDVLAMAMENMQRLSRIVDSLLSISRIESGKLDLQKTVVNICELIKGTVSDYKDLAREKALSLDCEVPEHSVDICLDPDKTKEVLINLISNSIKFTPEGGWVKVICTKQDGKVLISVQDSGVGIAKEDIPKLFDRFTQFGRKAGPGEKGTGLGLAIAKKLVEMHGGKIEVESKVNKGTTFTVSLPLTTETEAEGLPAETDKLLESALVNE